MLQLDDLEYTGLEGELNAENLNYCCQLLSSIYSQRLHPLVIQTVDALAYLIYENRVFSKNVFESYDEISDHNLAKIYMAAFIIENQPIQAQTEISIESQNGRSYYWAYVLGAQCIRETGVQLGCRVFNCYHNRLLESEGIISAYRESLSYGKHTNAGPFELVPRLIPFDS